MKPFLKKAAVINLIADETWDWFGWNGHLTINGADNALLLSENNSLLGVHVPGFANDYKPQQYTTKIFRDVPGVIGTIEFIVDEPTLSKIVSVNGSRAMLSTTTGSFTAVFLTPAQKVSGFGATPDTQAMKSGTWKVVDTNQKVFREERRLEVKGHITNQKAEGNKAGELGGLSEKYETGGRGPGTVSSGNNDPGGVSYGSYQLKSRDNNGKIGGRVKEFLESSQGAKWKDKFEGLTPGSKEFSDKWKRIATDNSDEFKQAQFDFVKRTHYDVTQSRLLDRLGLDLNLRSDTLRDVVWSTSVQHGPNTRIIDNALAGKDLSKLSDKEIIQDIYKQRADEHPAYEARYSDEESDALNSLSAE
ncbi:VgrG-related protein [Mucilaginibacter paludis]|uniref:Type VI secretion system spike protein VgrG3-like C-terminal domain-containing protein n=1 Tax=Mucilaginibacter paludis DSM 18603 TaxID=714943 RepID=H1Y8M0_9SPHI|nr:hypothetical protein [Mucilaginibacter paludis]EHQ26892.1 hypothetical protein Mucpa_2780 [Mucilaginibacter paludis DSM 18603]